MDVTEAPVSQRVDDLPERVAAALPGAMVSRLAALAELGHQSALAEKENHELRGAVAAALEAAARYKAEAESHAADNRGLRERVARQRSTIESLRRQLALGGSSRVLARVESALRGAESVSECDGPPPGVSPLAGRWLPWARGQR